jgi:hypothetical protein
MADPIVPPVTVPATPPASTTPPVVTPPVPDVTAAIAKEKALLKQKQEVDKAKREAEQAIARAKAEQAKVAQAVELAKTDPDAFAEWAGLDYAKWTQQKTRKAAPTPQDEIAGIKAELKRRDEEAKKNAEVAMQNAYNTTRKTIENTFVTTVKAASDKYELLSQRKDIGKLMLEVGDELWKEHVDSGGEQDFIPSATDVADKIEAYLEEEYLQYAKSKKIQAKLGAAPATTGVPATAETKSSALPEHLKSKAEQMRADLVRGAKEGVGVKDPVQPRFRKPAKVSIENAADVWMANRKRPT